MKRILAFLTISLLTSQLSYAVNPLDETKTFTTQTLSKETLIKDTAEKVSTMQRNIEDLQDIITKFDTCEAKGKMYIGKGIPEADSDNCVDVQSQPVISASKKPTFVGFTYDRYKGDMTKDSETINSSDPTQYIGRLRADQICNTEYPGSRAMTYDDLKYMLFQIPDDDSRTFNATFEYSGVWIFDALGIADDTLTPFTRDYNVTDPSSTHTDCDGWTTTDSAKQGTKLSRHYAEIYLKAVSCGDSGKASLACVYN